MYGFNLVAIYPTVEEARRVSDRLLAEGLTADDVRLTDASTRTSGEYVEREPHHERGFFDWLFASDVPEYDRDRYSSYLNENRAAVSVRVPDQSWHDRVVEIMEEFNPLDIEEDGHAVTHEHRMTDTAALSATSVPPTGTTARTEADRMVQTDRAATAHTEASTGMATRGMATNADLGATGRTDYATARTDIGATARTGMTNEHEEVIPVVKEELDVGKRVTERRTRVRSYVIERPVEEQVTLRDERVEIEHRPISRTGNLSMPQDRDIEVVERHEEPVVEKRVTGNEEIVVRKEVVERPETVRGTVRETKVEVDKEPAATSAGATRTTTTTDRTAGTMPPTPGRTDPTRR
jgi:hypothetical protein